MLFDFYESVDDARRRSLLRADNGPLVYKFGAFDLRVAQRLLTKSGTAVRLGSRALDILCVLAAHAGEIVSKEAIIARVWPTTFVDDANLRVQIGRLRRALGDGQGDARYIVNIPVRGYAFVASVACERDEPTRAPTFISRCVERASNHVQP